MAYIELTGEDLFLRFSALNSKIEIYVWTYEVVAVSQNEEE